MTTLDTSINIAHILVRLNIMNLNRIVGQIKQHEHKYDTS
jgi:hypothetical protein